MYIDTLYKKNCITSFKGVINILSFYIGTYNQLFYVCIGLESRNH